MGLSFDTVGTGQVNQSPGTTVTWTHTVGALTNGILIAGAKSGGSATLNSLVFAGQNMTKYVAGTSAAAMSVDVWYLLNPPSGLGTFNGTWTAGGGTNKIGVSMSYGSVNQTAPLSGSVINNPGITTSTSGSVTNASMGLNNWLVGWQGLTVSPGTTAIGNERGTTAQAAASNELQGADVFGGTLRWTNASARILDIGVFMVPFAYPTNSISDQFGNGATINAQWTKAGADANAITQGTGQLVITGSVNGAYNDLVSLDNYNLTSSNFYVNFAGVPDQTQPNVEMILYFSIDASNKVYWTLNNGNLTARKIVATVNSSVSSTPYDSTKHKWLRIRESSGTIFWGTSSDGITFGDFTQLANPFAVTAGRMSVQLGAFGTLSAVAGTFDNFNVTPTPATYTTFMTLMGAGNI